MELKENVFKVITEELEERKIITHKWLSRLTEIHNTLARNFLKDYVREKTDENYKICYMVYGKKSNGELILVLTSNDNDSELEKQQIQVIDRSIYSVQKIDIVFDKAEIYNVDKATYELQRMNLSSINYHKPIIPTEREVLIKTAIDGSIPDKEKFAKKPNLSSNQENKNPDEPMKCNGDTSKDVDKKREAENGKSSVPDKRGKTSSKTVSASKGSGSIAKFFQKDTSSSEKPIDKCKTTNKSSTEEMIVDKYSKKEEKSTKDLHGKIDNSEKKDLPKESSNDDSKTSKKKDSFKESKSKKRTSTTSKKTSKNQGEKKMKRIIVPDDSDSDEASDHNEEPFVEELEPDEPPKPTVEAKLEDMPRVKVIDGKKQRRKIVERTGLDEKGYFCTQKEVVYESCDSEDEESDKEKGNDSHMNKRVKIEASELARNTVPSKPSVADSKKGASAKKQASILNFFKKPQTS